MYNLVDVPKSFVSAIFNSGSAHRSFSTEVAANRMAIKFFGPNSAIAQKLSWAR